MLPLYCLSLCNPCNSCSLKKILLFARSTLVACYYRDARILDMSEDFSSIDKDQLISMIHFLEKRDEESKKENEELKELQETRKHPTPF